MNWFKPCVCLCVSVNRSSFTRSKNGTGVKHQQQRVTVCTPWTVSLKIQRSHDTKTACIWSINSILAIIVECIYAFALCALCVSVNGARKRAALTLYYTIYMYVNGWVWYFVYKWMYIVGSYTIVYCLKWIIDGYVSIDLHIVCDSGKGEMCVCVYLWTFRVDMMAVYHRSKTHKHKHKMHREHSERDRDQCKGGVLFDVWDVWVIHRYQCVKYWSGDY